MEVHLDSSGSKGLGHPHEPLALTWPGAGDHGKFQLFGNLTPAQLYSHLLEVGKNIGDVWLCFLSRVLTLCARPMTSYTKTLMKEASWKPSIL